MLDSGSRSIGDTGNVLVMSTHARMDDEDEEVDVAEGSGGWELVGLMTRGLVRHRSWGMMAPGPGESCGPGGWWGW